MSPSILALIATVSSLLLGPALLRATGDSARLRSVFEGFAVTIVAGLCLLHLGPHAIDSAGLPALLGLGAGVLLASLMRRDTGAKWSAALALSALGLHAVLDGAMLSLESPKLTLGVTLAIAAQRLPVSLGVTVGAGSLGRAVAVLSGLGALAAAGFVGAPLMQDQISIGLQAALEGLVVGGILHVVFVHRLPAPAPARSPAKALVLPASPTFRPAPSQSMVLVHPIQCAAPGCGSPGHLHDHSDDVLSGIHHHHSPDPVTSRASGVGGFLGLLALLGLGRLASHGALEHLAETSRAFASITLASAPALLMGFLLAGLATAFLKPAHASWLAEGGRGTRAVRGVVFGLPLPICSCGVVPMYESLVRRGVPLSAGLAFLIATPELGVDAVLLSAPLLGLPLTVARVLAAFAVAVLVAILVSRVEPDRGDSRQAPEVSPSGPAEEGRLARGLHFGFVELVDHTLPWILAGLVLAALAEPLLDHGLIATVPSALQVPLAALVGIPMYVCASGATPLAAIALHKGLSTGAALTFLLAGPATNVTTFGILTKLHGRALAIRFGLVLIVVATLVGWGVNLLDLGGPLTAHPGALLQEQTSWVSGGASVGLLFLTCASLWRQGVRGFVDQLLEPIHSH